MKPILNASQAWDALKQGALLICMENRTLFYQKQGKIGAWQKGWQACFSQKDFFDLYGTMTFCEYESKEEGIDIEKDDAYYQWRHKYL